MGGRIRTDSGRWRMPRGAGAVLAVAGAVAVIAAAALGVRVLYDRSTAHHDALVALARTDARANEARTLGWMLIDGNATTSADGLAPAERQAQLIAELHADAAVAAPEVSVRLGAYADTLAAELAALTTSGRESEATRIAVTRRETAFAAVEASLTAQAQRHAGEIKSAANVAEAGSAMPMTLAALAVAVLAWRYTHARRNADEGALRRSEARFRNLINDASDIIAVIDPALTMTYLSPSVARVLGSTVSHLLGREIVALFDEKEHAMLRTRLRALAAPSNMRISAEANLSTRDGSARYAEITASNLLHDPSISGIVVNIRDITERKELEQRLRRQALHDALTGLPNRALFIQNVEASLDQHTPTGGHAAVLFMDLDKFKSVNDTLGHNAGDELLIAVGRRLQTCVRPQDMVARLSGDEFAVLLRDVSVIEEVERQAQQILDVLRPPVAAGGAAIYTYVSIGIAIGAAAMESAGTLLRRADMAMYAAKRAGGGQYAIFDPAVHDTGPRVPMLRLADDLREAS